MKFVWANGIGNKQKWTFIYSRKWSNRWENMYYVYTYVVYKSHATLNKEDKLFENADH